MAEGAEGGLPLARQQLGERRVAGQVAAQHQGVHEEPRSALRSPRGCGRRRASPPPGRPCPACRERRRGRRPAGLVKGVASTLWRAPSTSRSAPRRSRSGRRPPARKSFSETSWRSAGKLQPGEPLSPVAHLAFERRAAQVLALPARKVGVPGSAARERRRLAAPLLAGMRGRGPHLAHEHPHRPAVRDDVVHGEQQRVIRVILAAGERQQGGAQQGAGRQIRTAGSTPAPPGAALGLCQRGGQGGQVDPPQPGLAETTRVTPGGPPAQASFALGEGGA